MVWTLSFQCRGPGFHPRSANKIPHAPRICTLKLQILPAETKTWCSQINNLKPESSLRNKKAVQEHEEKTEVFGPQAYFFGPPEDTLTFPKGLVGIHPHIPHGQGPPPSGGGTDHSHPLSLGCGLGHTQFRGMGLLEPEHQRLPGHLGCR